MYWHLFHKKIYIIDCPIPDYHKAKKASLATQALSAGIEPVTQALGNRIDLVT